MASPISGVNVIVAVGSVDGMAGAAACIRHAKDPEIQLVFTQAFQVNQVDVSKWPANRIVGLIDLGVNNEGQSPNPQMTVDFVKKIYDLGHKILFIADEHGKAAWQDVLVRCGHDKSELTIQPEDRKEYGSSCAILEKSFGESADDHTKALLRDGHQGDQMNFDTPFGHIFNTAVKSNLTDPARRPHLVKHLAQHATPDATIQSWMDEYAEMEANLPKILASRQDLGDGIHLYDAAFGRHDATAVFREAYKASPVVVLIGGTMQKGVSIATNRKELDILTAVQRAGVVAGGMPAKANFALEDREKAIAAVRAAMAQ